MLAPTCTTLPVTTGPASRLPMPPRLPLPWCAGTLVKHLEELGIGRPGTYAPTLNLLQA